MNNKRVLKKRNLGSKNFVFNGFHERIEVDPIFFVTSLFMITGLGIYVYHHLKNLKKMNVSLRAVDFIIQQEIVSKDQYTKYYSTPLWPKGDSGITIGVGYDLGYNTPAAIASDWAILPKSQIAILQSASGKTGIDAQTFLKNNPSLKSVVIPYETAVKVFVEKTLPRFAKAALKIYPGLDQLMPDAAGAIVSMVYNRGTALEGDRRKEMKAIVPLIAQKDYAGIADQIEASKRLWVGSATPWVAVRREKEAAMVRNAVRQYAVTDMVSVNAA